MIRLQTILLTSTIVLIALPRLSAEQPPNTPQLTIDVIDLFVEHLTELRNSHDNVLVYEKQHAALTEMVNMYGNSQVTFPMTVSRVTKSDVFFETPYLGRARIVLMFEDEAGGMYFGGSDYRPYRAAPSTELFNKLAPKTSLEIGQGIALDTAQLFGRRDQLLMDAEVSEIRFRAVSGISPDVVVIVHNFQVSDQPAIVP